MSLYLPALSTVRLSRISPHLLSRISEQRSRDASSRGVSGADYVQ
jgi:hypothetical protein